MEIPSATLTPQAHTLIQLVKSPTGQMQVRGLLPGQQLIRLSDGRLQLLTFPSSMLTSTAATPTTITTATTPSSSTTATTLGDAVAQALAPPDVAIYAPTSVAGPMLQLDTLQGPQTSAAAQQIRTPGQTVQQSTQPTEPIQVAPSAVEIKAKVLGTSPPNTAPSLASSLPAAAVTQALAANAPTSTSTVTMPAKTIAITVTSTTGSPQKFILTPQITQQRNALQFSLPSSLQTSTAATPSTSNTATTLGAAVTRVLAPPALVTHAPTSITGPTLQPIAPQGAQTTAVAQRVPLEFIESRFSKNPLLAMGGYTFHFKQDGCSKKIWLCSERKRKRCPVRIHTTNCSRNPQLILELGSHSHEPDPAKIDKKRMILKLMENAVNSHEPPKLIIARNVQGMPVASKAILPTADNLSRMIRKVRQDNRGSLDIPIRLEDINFPTVTNEVENVVNVNSGQINDSRFMMQLEIIGSGKSPVLVVGGYTFHFKKDGCSKKIWACSERKRKSCLARIYTTPCIRNPQFLLEAQSHSHEPDPAKIDIKRMMVKLTEDAINSHEPAKLIIAKNIEGMPLASKAILPTADNLSRMIRKVRQDNRGSLDISKRCEDINLPTIYVQTNEKEDVILFDSCPSTDTNLPSM